MAVLFGVTTGTLVTARLNIEAALGVKLKESEGVQCGIHYTLSVPDRVIDLKNNIEYADHQSEVDELAEPRFPNFKFLLYVNYVDEYPEYLRKVETANGPFVKLRVK